MAKKTPTIPAGRFKAECLALIDRVAETRETCIVTKRGRPVVEIVPVRDSPVRPLRGSVTVTGDIVGPVFDAWNVER